VEGKAATSTNFDRHLSLLLLVDRLLFPHTHRSVDDDDPGRHSTHSMKDSVNIVLTCSGSSSSSSSRSSSRSDGDGV